MLTKFKSKILRTIKSKRLNVFGLFLLLTFVFSALTKLSKIYTDTITLDIQYTNLPKQIVITSEELPKCSATVSAYGFDLLWYKFRKHTLKVDFNKDVYVKDSTYIWVASKFKHKIREQLSSSSEVISFDHDTIRFPFETLSIKKVPVVLNSKVFFKPGYDILDQFNVQPDSVNVIGSALEIAKIENAETELLNLKDVAKTINTIVLLKKPDNPNLKFSNYKIKVSGKVEKFTEGTLDVPITVVNKPLDVSINYFPKNVTVSYYVSLANYKEIKPLDFKVECDFSETESNNKAFFVPKLVKAPNTVKNVKLKQNKIEYIITQ